ncbi:MAG: pyruvate, water dikinase regulatory protein [Burkholderiales bacterium]
MSKPIVLHLVSHASGELVEMLARNAVAQLEDVTVERKLWKMVRRLGQIPEILGAIAGSRGYVIHSISHTDVREALEGGCYQMRVPCQFALEPLIGQLAKHFDVSVHTSTSSADEFDDDYYRRVEAMKYALTHDDGVDSHHLDDADVIVVGVSRSTKTPTCMYLASRGIKAANVPLVPGLPAPDGLLNAKGPLVVGLTVSPNRLATVRTARMKELKLLQHNSDYVDVDALKREVTEARRLCAQRGWPVVDTTYSSIENTAERIIDMLRARGGEHS